MKIYRGKYNKIGGCPVTVEENGTTKDLDPRFDLCCHSPDGFQWSYSGSGPAQLALALLTDHFQNDEKALEIYQQFKSVVVSNLPEQNWELSSEQIDKAVETIRIQL